MKKIILLFILIPILSIGQDKKCITEITYVNDKYKGCINDSGNPEGYGIMTFENNDVYVGFWKNGKREGLGKLTTNEGNIYEGNWRENIKNGKGILIKKNEDGTTTTSKGIFENNIIIEGKSVVSLNGYEIANSTISYKSYTGIVNREINLLKGPGSDYEVIKILIPGIQLFIVSDKTVNDYYNVIDVITNEEGYVNKDYVELGKEIVVKEDTGNFKVTGVSDNPELSKVNIFNNTKVKASIKMGASNYLFSPYEKRDLNIPPGEYKIIVSSPNVIPFIEKVEFERGKNYMREYIIIKTNKN